MLELGYRLCGNGVTFATLKYSISLYPGNVCDVLCGHPVPTYVRCQNSL